MNGKKISMVLRIGGRESARMGKTGRDFRRFGDDAAGSKAVREDHSAFRHDGLRLFIGHRAARRLQNLRPHCHPVERRFELLPVRRSAEAVLKFAFGRGVLLSKSPAKPFLTRRVVRRDQPRSPRRESYRCAFSRSSSERCSVRRGCGSER